MLVALGSLAAGAVLSILVSRYYFIRSLKYRLTVYVHSYSRVLVGVAQDVKESLDVRFQGSPVDDLGEMVFLIANEGAHPIKDVVRPLVASVPEGTKLLDAVVLHVHPNGRTVSASPEEKSVELRFDLLNPGDYFLLKFLIDGSARPNEIDFSLTAVGLPPRLKASPRAYATSEDSSKTDLVLALIGLFLLGCGVSVGAVLLTMARARPELLPFGRFDASTLAIALTVGFGLAALVAVVVALIGAMMIGASLFGGSFPPRPTFVLPPELRQHLTVGHSGQFIGVGHPFVDDFPDR